MSALIDTPEHGSQMKKVNDINGFPSFIKEESQKIQTAVTRYGSAPLAPPQLHSAIVDLQNRWGILMRDFEGWREDSQIANRYTAKNAESFLSAKVRLLDLSVSTDQKQKEIEVFQEAANRDLPFWQSLDYLHDIAAAVLSFGNNMMMKVATDSPDQEVAGQIAADLDFNLAILKEVSEKESAIASVNDMMTEKARRISQVLDRTVTSGASEDIPLNITIIANEYEKFLPVLDLYHVELES